jgi:butyryl-CoA dehydrogenase/short/branched chain acyl-CoA dehydrogenase
VVFWSVLTAREGGAAVALASLPGTITSGSGMEMRPIETTRSTSLNTLSEEEEMLQGMVREFAREQLLPLVETMDRQGSYDLAILPRLFELGIMGIEIPETLGGGGGSFFMSVLAIEEISAIDAAVGVLVDVHNTLTVKALLRFGSRELQERYLPQLATSKIGAYSLSEPGAGSDAFALRCRAAEDGDHYVLDGQKIFVTNAAEADLFLVFASVDPDQGYRGISSFLIEKGTDGFEIGKRESKLGIRASSTCEIVFEGCRVPRENMVGEKGKGYKVAIESLNEGRIGIGAQMLGLARRALELGIAYARTRKQFGRPLADFQAMQFKLAELATEVETSRLMVYNAARLIEEGRPFVREAAMAKLVAGRVAERVASEVVEIFGGYGFITEYPVEKLYRDSKIGKIYEGTSFMQLQTIARTILGEGV